MKRFMILLLLCAAAQQAFCQINDYHALVNRAELKIIDKDYAAALACYDTAFTRKEFPFAQDLYNASLCALQTGRQSRALAFCYRLADKGIGSAFFLKASVYRPLASGAAWKAFIAYANNSRETFLHNNKKTMAFMDGLFSISDTIPVWNGPPDMNSRADNIRIWVNDSLSQELLHFIQQNGYPSEELAGCHVINDTLLSDLPRFSTLIEKRWLLVNIYVDTLFRDVLLEAGVRKGLLKPEVYLDITRHTINGNDMELRSFYSWYGCGIYADKGISKERVAQYWSSVGACSPDDYLKKFAYNISHPHGDFHIHTFGIRQDNGDEEPAEERMRYSRQHELVVQHIPGCKE